MSRANDLTTTVEKQSSLAYYGGYGKHLHLFWKSNQQDRCLLNLAVLDNGFRLC